MEIDMIIDTEALICTSKKWSKIPNEVATHIEEYVLDLYHSTTKKQQLADLSKKCVIKRKKQLLFSLELLDIERLFRYLEYKIQSKNTELIIKNINSTLDEVNNCYLEEFNALELYIITLKKYNNILKTAICSNAYMENKNI